MTTPTCPKCSKKMEPGFVIDKTYGDGIASPPEWAEGKPEPSFWTGVKLHDKKRYAVSTYRCLSCGYLESYAQ